MEPSFENFIKKQRRDFVKEISKILIHENVKLRTEADSLLIAYDQLFEKTTSQQQTIERLRETLDGLLDDFKYYISQMDEEPQRAGYMLEAEQLLSTTEPIDQ